MSEILLVRHAKSYANVRDVTFGNVESPLNEQGIGQALALGDIFREQYDIEPKAYKEAVLASEYTRPQQTARFAGFQRIEIDPVINESHIPQDLLSGRQIIEKHTRERWIPEELRQRAQRFVALVRQGELGHQIYFTHGFFIASVLAELSDECETQQQVSPYIFDSKRGYIPRLATITPVTL